MKYFIIKNPIGSKYFYSGESRMFRTGTGYAPTPGRTKRPPIVFIYETYNILSCLFYIYFSPIHSWGEYIRAVSINRTILSETDGPKNPEAQRRG